LPAWVFTRESSAPCQGTHTNTVERAIRPICLSRKNALFASGDDGGARWAAVASLVETCKLNGVDPQRYFTDVLTRLVNGWPNSRIDELMPWRWKTVSDASGPFRLLPDGQARSSVFQHQGMSSSMRLFGQPLTRRVSTSVK
jgi:hypothetical protein